MAWPQAGSVLLSPSARAAPRPASMGTHLTLPRVSIAHPAERPHSAWTVLLCSLFGTHCGSDVSCGSLTIGAPRLAGSLMIPSLLHHLQRWSLLPAYCFHSRVAAEAVGSSCSTGPWSFPCKILTLQVGTDSDGATVGIWALSRGTGVYHIQSQRRSGREARYSV